MLYNENFEKITVIQSKYAVGDTYQEGPKVSAVMLCSE